MENTQAEINDVLESCQPDIDRLNLMVLNMYSISNIRYWYYWLSNFPKNENIHEDIIKMEAITTSIVITYGRMFGKGTGTRVLKEAAIPEELKKVHASLIDLRHARYAHHGEHKTVQKGIDVKFVDSIFKVNATLELDICLGAPKHWRPLFVWLDEYIYTEIHKQVSYLTKKTGIPWEMPHQSAPYWIE